MQEHLELFTDNLQDTSPLKAFIGTSGSTEGTCGKREGSSETTRKTFQKLRNKDIVRIPMRIGKEYKINIKPTPVSALIHAATMVTAGIFLIIRSSPLLEMSNTALFYITIIGALTAFFAASVALVQNDLKKVIAYSTASQLGYISISYQDIKWVGKRHYSTGRTSDGERLIDILPEKDEYI